MQTRLLIATVAISATTLLGLSACSKNDNETAGQKLDQAIDKTQEVASNAATATGNALESAAQGASEAATNTGAAIRDSASSAGASPAANNVREMASEAVSTVGTALDDVSITAKIKVDLAKDPGISALAIDVDTKDGAVTLTGKVPTAAARDRAESLVKMTNGVISVNNQLLVQP